LVNGAVAELRDEAEALAEALELGVCEVAAVVAWADAQIERLTLVPTNLCDVSLARELYPQDVAGLLRQSPGSPDRTDVNGLVLMLVKDKLDGDPSQADRVAWTLYRMALADQIEDADLEQIGWWAWDGLAEADAGYIEESRDEVLQLMAAALDCAAAKAAVTWSVGIKTQERA
jgi:hypothetical protein